MSEDFWANPHVIPPSIHLPIGIKTDTGRWIIQVQQ